MNELSILIKKTREVIPEGIKDAIVKTAVAVVDESPKFSGQLKASTNIGLNSPDNSVVLAANYSFNAIQGTGSAAKGQFASAVGNYKSGDTVYISNDLDYAEIQETKYGNLMFAKAARKFQSALDRGIDAAK